MGLGEEIFGYSLETEFDRLSLPNQELHVRQLKEKYEYFRKRFQANSGIKGGRPRRYSDEFCEEIIKNVNEIMQTKEYLERRDPREKDMAAYIIYVERLLKNPESVRLSAENGINHNKDSIWQAAKAFRQAVQRYRKAGHTRT